MKPWIAVIAVTPVGRVAKYLDFDDEARALAHVEKHGGFVAATPSEAFMEWRALGEALVIDPPPPSTLPPSRDMAAELDEAKAAIAALVKKGTVTRAEIDAEKSK